MCNINAEENAGVFREDRDIKWIGKSAQLPMHDCVAIQTEKSIWRKGRRERNVK